MANKGETKTQKKLSVGRVRDVARKGRQRFVHKSKAGAHSKNTSVPLVFAVRNLLSIAKDGKEAKRIITSGAIKVNGTVRKDTHFNVGLFDLVENVSGKMKYRAVYDSHGRLGLVDVEAKAKEEKLCRIIKKKTMDRGMIQLTVDDGSTFREKKTNLKVGDTIKVELPSRKIVEDYGLKKGNTVYVTGGTHVATIAKIQGIIEGTMSRPKLLELEEKSGEKFLTVQKNVFVIGEGKSEIETGKSEGEKDSKKEIKKEASG